MNHPSKDPNIQITQHDYVKVEPARQLRPDERSALEILLSQNFPGTLELRKQSHKAVVEAQCSHCASIFLCIDKSQTAPAHLLAPMPLSAYTTDTDGMFVEVLATVTDGYLDELRIWRGDGQPIFQFPDLSTATLVAPDKP